MFDWWERLITAVQQPPEPEDHEPTASPSPSSYSRPMRAPSRLSRESAFVHIPSSGSSRHSRPSSPILVKRESVEPSLSFSTPPLSYSLHSSSSRRSSLSSNIIKREETELDLSIDPSVASMGATIPFFHAGYSPRGIVYKQGHGHEWMSEVDEARIYERELEKMKRIKAIRESMPLGDSTDEDSDDEGRRSPDLPAREPSPPRRTRDQRRVSHAGRGTLAEGSAPRTSDKPTVASRQPAKVLQPPPPVPQFDSVTQASTTAASSRSSASRASATNNEAAVASTSQSEPLPSFSFKFGEAPRPLHRASTWPVLKPAAQSIKYGGEPSSSSAPQQPGKVATTMSKVAAAKLRAKKRGRHPLRVNPCPPTVLGKEPSWRPKRKWPETSKIRRLEQEERALALLKRSHELQLLQEAEERKANEEREAAEAEAARLAAQEERFRRIAAQRDWQYVISDRLDEEQLKADNIHVYRESLLGEFWVYDEKWKVLNTPPQEGEPLLVCDQIPWPIHTSDARTLAGPTGISEWHVYNFILHPLRPGLHVFLFDMRQHFLREEVERWSSDVMAATVAERVVPEHRAAVAEGVEHVLGVLRRLLKAEEDLGWECWG
ncbi:hypothetical protein BDW22DRAFT_1349040 [Trametopsis cervina]|nr:hypothetical protein BDW22DRAFT_1349040 [Trametopsis cervina]